MGINLIYPSLNSTFLPANNQFAGIVAKNLSQKLSYLPSKMAKMEVTHYNDAILTNSRLHSCMFNNVYCNRLSIDFLRKIKNIYTRRKQQVLLWMPPESKDNRPLDEVMICEGFHYVECCIGMVYDVQSTYQCSISTAPLQIKDCTNIKDFSDFSKIISAVYSPARTCIEKFYQAVESLKHQQRSNHKFFIGYINHHPVVTASIFVGDKEFGIYDIATHPHYRRRGYASKMFKNAMFFGQKLNKKLGVLQSSPEAFNLYKQLGCKEVCKFHLWSNEELDF